VLIKNCRNLGRYGLQARNILRIRYLLPLRVEDGNFRIGRSRILLGNLLQGIGRGRNADMSRYQACFAGQGLICLGA
jgi:hypothetical protein